MRTGLIARKMGMTRVFQDDGSHIPVTVLQLDNCRAIATRTEQEDGYTAVQVGFGKAKVKNVSKAMRGQFAKAKAEPTRGLVEFRVSSDALVEPGVEFSAKHFADGQFVDCCGTSLGKGFAGGMKRHHFHGLRASHGVSVSHRSLGSTGQCQYPGRVFPGKKMAGQMGNTRVTAMNLQVVATDEERGLILVKGAVPGSKGGWVEVRDAIKRPKPENVPFPAGIRAAAEAPVQEVDAGETEE